MTKMKAYQERLITLLKDTITLLCRNGLEYDQQFCVEGLLGVTLDKDKEVFLIPIKELITDKGVGTDDGVGIEAEQDRASDTDADVDSSIVKNEGSSSRKRKRHKHREREIVLDGGEEDEVGTNFDTGPVEWNTESNDPDNTEDSISNLDDSTNKRRRNREPVDIKSEDVVVIKEEVDDAEFASAFHDSSMDSSIQNRDGSSLDYFAQPGTSQGQLGFPMDQLQGGGQGLPPGMLGSAEGDGSWLQNPGDMSQQPSQDWQQQKHQINKCEQCNKEFAHMQSLARHLRTIHHEGYQHVCDFCGAVFNRRDSLARHMKSCSINSCKQNP